MGIELLLGSPTCDSSGTLLQIFKEYSPLSHHDTVRYIVPTPTHVHHVTSRLLSDGVFPGLLGDPVRTWDDFLIEVISPPLPVRRITDLEYQSIGREIVCMCEGTVFQGISALPGFPSALLRTLRWLRRGSISGKDLRNFAGKSLHDLPGSCNKASDLSSLYEAFERKMNSIGGYDQERLAGLFEESDAYRQSEKYECLLFSGFQSMTSSSVRVLKAILTSASEKARIVFAPDFDPKSAECHPRGEMLFREINSLPGVVTRSVSDGARPAGIRHAMNGISGKRIEMQDCDDSVLILSAPDRSKEVESVAEEVRRLIAQGVSPEAIAVTALDDDPYRDLLYRSCRSMGIAVYGETVPLLHSGLAQALLAALSLVRTGWSTESVEGVLQSQYLGCSPEECSRILYLAKDFGPRGRTGWLSSWGEDEDLFKKRIRSLSALSDLEDGFSAASSAEEIATALSVFLETLEQPTDCDRMQVDCFALKAIESQILSIPDVPGSDAVELLADWLHNGRCSISVGSGCGITYLPISQLSGMEFRILIVMGMLQQPEGNPINLLHEAEREAMSSFFPQLLGIPDERRVRRVNATSSLGRATERLYLSYPLSDSLGRAQIPSIHLEAILRAFGSPPARDWGDYLCNSRRTPVSI